MSREGEELVKLEVKEMLKKGAIRKVQPSKGEFASNLILVKQKDVGQRPVINLKQLNAYIQYCHFKMEGLQNLECMLQKGDYMSKLDLKRCIFFNLTICFNQDNLLAFFVGQETCTSFFAFALVWDQHHKYYQNC